jgi:NAD(P)-dependent dehydrogenase (short-subunit alcohol dehydrogenase family)
MLITRGMGWVRARAAAGAAALEGIKADARGRRDGPAMRCQPQPRRLWVKADARSTGLGGDVMGMQNVSFDFSGKVVVITGAGKGIGRKTALAFAAAGASVVLSGRHPDTLEATRAEAEKSGPRALAIPTDIQNVGEINALVERTVATFGKIDVLVNNAGVNRTGPSLEVTEETWDWIIDTNVKGMFFACQAAGRHMIARRAGKIVNIGSIISNIGLGSNVPYASSKGAVLQMTKSLALEWAKFGVNVNAVGPGYVLTDQVRWLFEQEEFKSRIMAKAPSGAVGTEEDIASTTLYLASDAASHINGAMIYVDGAAAAGWMGPE